MRLKSILEMAAICKRKVDINPCGPEKKLYFPILIFHRYLRRKTEKEESSRGQQITRNKAVILGRAAESVQEAEGFLNLAL